MNHRIATVLLLSFTCASIGFFFAYTWESSPPLITHTSDNSLKHSSQKSTSLDSVPTDSSTSSPSPKNTIPTGSIADERVIRFSSLADYQAFLSQNENHGFTILGQDSRLLSIRVRLSSPYTKLNIDGAEILHQFPVSHPTPPTADAQKNALGFAGNALSWLGLNQDNSSWGLGVVVAVIDSGVQQHPALLKDLSHLTLEGIPAGPPLSNHGTAVASIISGDISQTPGVAPASDILSIRIDDSEGIATTYTLAQGILAAVDAGAHIINISMGTYGHSTLVAEAVDYAIKHGVVVVAAAGNEGLVNTLPYPAAYPNVISVGAIEAKSEHLDFSNTSDNLSITAPGFGVHAAWSTNHLTAFSGTSASAPFVSGAIAALLSQSPDLTPTQAADIVMKYTTDGGYSGNDSAFGSGILNLARIMYRDIPNIYDVAITSHIYQPTPDGKHEFLVNVQNLGTAPLVNIPVSIDSPTGTLNTSLKNLAPGETQTLRIPAPSIPADSSITVSSAVHSGKNEISLDNNSRTTSFETKK